MKVFAGFLVASLLIGGFMWQRPLLQRVIALAVLSSLICVAYFFFNQI